MPDAPETGVMTPGGGPLGAEPGKPRPEADQPSLESMFGAAPGPKPEGSPIQANDTGQLKEENRELQEQLEAQRRELEALRQQQAERKDQLSVVETSEGVFGKVLDKFRHAYAPRIIPGQEEREPGKLRRLFCRLPIIGGWIGSGTWTAADAGKYLALDKPTIEQVGRAVDSVREVGLVGQGILETAVNAAPTAGILGFGMRLAGDTFRWVGGEKTARLLAREIAWKKLGRGTHIELSNAWNVMIRRHVPELRRLMLEASKQGKVDPQRVEPLIREALYAKLTHSLLTDILSPEQFQKLNEVQTQELEVVTQAYTSAETLLNKLDSSDQAKILSELPNWITRREVANHVELIAKRGVINGVKTAAWGGAFTLVKGFFASRAAELIGADIVKKLEASWLFLKTGFESAIGGLGGWLNQLGNSIQLQPQATGPQKVIRFIGPGR